MRAGQPIRRPISRPSTAAAAPEWDAAATLVMHREASRSEPGRSGSVVIPLPVSVPSPPVAPTKPGRAPSGTRWRLGVRGIAALVCVAALGVGALTMMRPVPVSSARVTRGAAIKAVYATGVVEALERVNVKARAAGPIKSLSVREGDHVSAGQLLGQIDAPHLDFDVQRGRADFIAAQARVSSAPQLQRLRAEKRALEVDLRQARLDLARVEKLAANGSIPDADVDRARAHADILAQRVSVLDAQQGEIRIGTGAEAARQRAILGALTSRASDAELRTPIAGTVLARHVSEGEVVTPNQTVLRIGDLTRLHVEAEVDEADVARIQTGMPSMIRVYGLGDAVFSGRVEQVFPDAERDRRTYRVHVEFDGLPSDVRAGMSVQVNVIVDRHEDALLVPREAVHDSGWVWVIDGHGRLRKKHVKIGLSDLARTEVSGISEGEAVVVGAASALKEGQKVAPEAVQVREPDQKDGSRPVTQ